MPATTNQDNNIEALEALSQGSNKFAISLYQALSKDSKDNLVVSPISLQMVLALTFLGGKGQVAEEIRTALHLPEDRNQILLGHKLLLQELRHPVLNMVNKLFVEKTSPVKQEYQTTAKDYFLSTVESLDFAQNPDNSRQIINKWVEDNTNKKIKDLLPDGSIDSMTRLVLTNAVHFKAKWQHKFNVEDTRPEDFHISATEKVQVPMMHIKKKFGFKHNPELGAKILEMPYEGREFNMYIILPDEIEGLAQVESKLQSLNLADEFSSLTEMEVILSMPRMKMEHTMDLKKTLQDMGMSTMFIAPDLSYISDEPLQVSKVVQKAFIEINEEGTEAAAATATEVGYAANNNVAFIADHPFVFIISHKKSKSTLFSGSLKAPPA